MLPKQLLEKMGLAPEQELPESLKKALVKKLTFYRHGIDLVETAKGLGLEKETNDMWDSMGLSEAQWSDLQVMAMALKNLSGAHSIALLAVEGSNFSIREKLVLAWMLK